MLAGVALKLFPPKSNSSNDTKNQRLRGISNIPQSLKSISLTQDSPVKGGNVKPSHLAHLNSSNLLN
uniref:Uncharacterized protein n=1 Tax=Manihot esculenta TaxID=3983 RepID=A0A2C9V5P6_MANES